MHHVTKYMYFLAKTEEYQGIFPNFQNHVYWEKYLKDNKNNNLNLAWTYLSKLLVALSM